MKAVILAGGLGTRLSEETQLRPKPMVEIGGRPMLWHIMKHYSSFGVNEFIICAGYKGYLIKEYFANYYLHQADVTFDLRDNLTEFHVNHSEPWRVTILDTGLDTMTGGRLKRAQPYIGNDTFCFTYGDGLSDINIQQLVTFHKAQKTKATLTAIRMPGRFGAIDIQNQRITRFEEKPDGHDGWINGGFFVLEPSVLELIPDDACIWEQEPLETLALNSELSAFQYSGYWQNMDTLRDKLKLEALWESGQVPWKVDN